MPHCLFKKCGIARSKLDGTRAETRFALSAKRMSPFKLAGHQFSQLLAADVCASAVVMVVMLDTPCSEVECKTTGYPLTHIFPLHFPSRAPPCAIRFQTRYCSDPVVVHTAVTTSVVPRSIGG